MQKQKAMEAFGAVDGLIAPHEGALLYDTAAKAIGVNGRNCIVEIGSFLGKSTVALAAAVEDVRGAKVYAIDPHAGDMMYPGDIIRSGPPTYDRFVENIKKAAVASAVTCIREKAENVWWNQPIALLFIDGLHDYINVSGNYAHFRKYLDKGAYVAIHDYKDGFPGIDMFVDGMIRAGEMEVEARAGSLMVMRVRKSYPQFEVPLVVTSYVVPEQRAVELADCLRLNLANPFISEIHVLVESSEDEYSKELNSGSLKCMVEVLQNPKIRRVAVGKRVTYSEIFEYASSRFNGSPVIVSNADIWFDSTLGFLGQIDLDGRFLCISRDDMSHMMANSQDTWVFKAPIQKFTCDWYMGPRGSENKVAYEAAKAGLEVGNPALDIKTHHKHASSYRVGVTLEQLPGPYLYVSPVGIDVLKVPRK